MKQVALLSVIASVAMLTSGCTVLADEEQKKEVTETFAALPEPVNRALRAGRLIGIGSSRSSAP